MRTILIVLVVLALFLPAVHAQAPAAPYFVTADRAEQTVVLSEGGRGSASFVLSLRTAGTVCIQQGQVTMALMPSPFPKYTGASIEPFEARWTMPMGPSQSGGDSRHALIMAWDVANTPANAVHTYQVNAGRAYFEGGPCTPASGSDPRDGPLVRITACLPPTRSGPSGPNCEQGAESSGTAIPAAEAPGPTLVLVGVVCVAVVAAGRYHKKKMIT